jgi:trehalose synthase
MLHAASKLSQMLSGRGDQWRRPYALPQPAELVAQAPVWFNAYPPASITKEGQSVLQSMGSDALWSIFEDMGIRALHTGPVKLAGGYRNRAHTPTVDGWFDRISLDVDPVFGTNAQYRAMAQTAARHQGVIAGDLIPGHTGKGADFLLALRKVGEYAGVYDLVEIAPGDWSMLPDVADEWESANLTPEQVEALAEKGYLPGRLERVLFSTPGASREPSGYDATGVVTGVDGVKRRFVYLHYFKPGQPTLNWCDPSMGAQRIVAGDIVQTLHMFGAKILRLDANPFLGVEPAADSADAWSEGHPLSAASTDLISWLVRKAGGRSFQELNMSLEDIKTFSEYGPDLSYDFITRPAVEHAALTGDAGFLRFMLKLMQQYEIDPVALVHDLQNHDEITYEMVHLANHAEEYFDYEGRELRGASLREAIQTEMKNLALAPGAPYNKATGNGLCTTFAGLIASRLGLSDPYHLTGGQAAQMRQIHLLLAAFNAMQPGVFGVSGWDLVGALPLHPGDVPELVKDGDYRWVNRGAYDLLGEAPQAEKSSFGLPRAVCVYGDLPSQLKDPDSFASRLKAMIRARSQYGLHLAELLGYPEVRNPGVVLMAHLLPDHTSLEVTAINFGDDPAEEVVDLGTLPNTQTSYAECVDILTGLSQPVPAQSRLSINLRPLEAKALVLR